MKSSFCWAVILKHCNNDYVKSTPKICLSGCISLKTCQILFIASPSTGNRATTIKFVFTKGLKHDNSKVILHSHCNLHLQKERDTIPNNKSTQQKINGCFHPSGWNPRGVHFSSVSKCSLRPPPPGMIVVSKYFASPETTWH